MNTTNCTYLGITKDNCGRDVDIYSDGIDIYIIYDKDTPEEYSTSASIAHVKAAPDNYLFTPYVDFLSKL